MVSARTPGNVDWIWNKRWPGLRESPMAKGSRAIPSMNVQVIPSGQACGATVTGADLSRPLDAAAVAAIRSA